MRRMILVKWDVSEVIAQLPSTISCVRERAG